MFRDDPTRLRHMLDAARRAVSSAAGRTREDLATDSDFALICERLLEIIGEAARHVSPGLQAGHPEIAWPLIIGMRDRLAHAYFEVDADIVWDTITRDLPPLITALEEILGRSER